jgi:hypothetical protein
MIVGTTDIIFALATLLFMTSMYPAIRKLQKVDESTAQSLLHNEITLIGHILMLVLAIMLNTTLSIFINVFSVVCRLYIIYLVRIKRTFKLKYKSDIVYHMIKIIKNYKYNEKH